MRRVNREKSQKKILELTKKHQAEKAEKKLKAEESLSDDEDEEMKEESKSSPAIGVNGNAKQHSPKNKHEVAPSKLKNKRQQKDAIKKNKMKRQKGVQKAVVSKSSDKMDTGSDDE